MDGSLKEQLNKRLIDSEPVKAVKKLDVEDVYGRGFLLTLKGSNSLPDH